MSPLEVVRGRRTVKGADLLPRVVGHHFRHLDARLVVVGRRVGHGALGVFLVDNAADDAEGARQEGGEGSAGGGAWFNIRMCVFNVRFRRADTHQ